MIGSKKDIKNSSAADLWRDSDSSEGGDLGTPKAFDADVPPSHNAGRMAYPPGCTAGSISTRASRVGSTIPGSSSADGGRSHTFGDSQRRWQFAAAVLPYKGSGAREQKHFPPYITRSKRSCRAPGHGHAVPIDPFGSQCRFVCWLQLEIAEFARGRGPGEADRAHESELAHRLQCASSRIKTTPAPRHRPELDPVRR